MSSQFLLQLPTHLEKAYQLGDIAVNSGVARYAKGANIGQIVAHLEPTTPMLSVGMSAVSTHAAFALEGAKFAKGAIDTVKLNKIIQLTQSIQSLSAVNLAISSVSLGISVVGFAVVLHKLNQLDNRLNQLDNRLKSIEVQLNGLKKNENIKLVREVRLGFKTSITLIHQLEEQGWNTHLDTEIAKQLNKVEVLLREVIDRYIDRDYINVSSELAQYLYSSYANLLKAYLTTRYEHKKSLDYPGQRTQILADFSHKLTSPDFLDELYESYLTNGERRFLESELDYILELYKYGCKNAYNAVDSHHEILKTVPLKQFRRWRKLISQSNEPLIWIEHTA